MSKRTYVIKSGKHHTPERIYVTGDKIELTDEEAKALANKLIDPSSLGLSAETNSSLEAENESLKARIASLEAENEQLREAIDEDSED
jgi:cell division protein FtsB